MLFRTEMNNKRFTSLFKYCAPFDLQNKSFIRAVSVVYVTKACTALYIERYLQHAVQDRCGENIWSGLRRYKEESK